MEAIVTAFDDPHREQIENIWGELKAVFGLQGIAGTPRPHITYQWADAYRPEIEGVLGRVAAMSPPFTIDTHGLGVFRGDEISLYLHITNGRALTELHARLWREAAPLGASVREVFAPATWLPHITFASGAIPDDDLTRAMQFLSRREYNWTLPLTNLCLAADAAPTDWRRWPLTA